MRLKFLFRRVRPEHSFPSAPDGFLALGLLFLVMVLFGGRFHFLREDGSLIVERALYFLSPPLFLCLVRRYSVFSAFRFRRISGRNLFLVCLSSVAFTFLLMGILPLLEALFRRMGIDYEASVRPIRERIAAVEQYGRAWSYLLLGGWTGFCEEFFFRGFLLSAFSRSFSLWKSVLYTSALFGALHGIPPQILATFFLGFFFAVVTSVTDSLWAGVLAHALNNVTVLSLEWSGEVSGLPGYILLPAMGVFIGSLALLFLEAQRSQFAEGKSEFYTSFMKRG